MKKLTAIISCLIGIALMTHNVYAIDYSDFSDLSGFTLGANAQSLNTPPDGILHLSSGTWQRTGYAILTDPITLGNSFSTHFTFQITNNINGGADWMVFNIQTESGLSAGNAVSVEYDIYNNGSRDDYSGNHIGLNINHYFASDIVSPVTPDFNNGELWHTWIYYDGSKINIYASMSAFRPTIPYISEEIDVLSILGTSDVYLGFHAASGAYGADFDVLTWTFSTPMSNDIYGILAFFDESVFIGTLAGEGPGASADGRLNALRNMLEMAGELISIADIDGACGQLDAVISKCDGNTPDFVTGDAVSELYVMVLSLMEELGCNE